MTHDPNAVLEYWKQALPLHEGIHYRGAIPEDKLAKVCEVYRLSDPGSVLVLYDDTLFGGASEGFIVTASQFGFKAISTDPQLVTFTELNPGDVQYDGQQVTVRGEIVAMTGNVAALKTGLGQALRQTVHATKSGGLSGPYRRGPGSPQARKKPSLLWQETLTILQRVLSKHGSLYYQGHIPSRKLRNVVKLHGIEDPNHVLALYDDTIFGSATEGFVITHTHLFFKGIADDPLSVELDLLRATDIEHDGHQLRVKGKKIEMSGDGVGLSEKLGQALRVIVSGGKTGPAGP